MTAGTTAKAQLLFGLAILVALGALLAAGARTDPPAAAAGQEDLTALSIRLEPQVAHRVEQLRGLDFDQVPKPEVVDSDYLNRLGAREIERTGGLDGAAADEATLRILGLLEPDEQLESIYGATGDLAAAAYDPHSNRLYVVSDAVDADPALVEFVLSHELDHALEDQKFGIGGGAQLDDDATLASLALTEGSATAVMIDYASRYIGYTDLLAATATVGADDAGVPGFYVDQLTWTYFGGARFISALRELAGGWKLVDYAVSERPPATTEQVLHVDKYVHDEQALSVEVQDGALTSRGWRRAGGGVVGELSTQQLLELGASEAEARHAGAGWGGDRYELWRRDASPTGCADPCRADFVLVVDWRMDSEAEAAELGDALVGYLDDGLAGTLRDDDTWQLDDGYAAAAVAGDEAALVFAPDEATALAVGNEQVAP